MSGLLDVFRHEFRRIFTVKSAFAVMVLGAAFYALFYPQPYLNEALRDVPIALVDRDGTQSSRDFARRVDATSDVAITAELPDVLAACGADRRRGGGWPAAFRALNLRFSQNAVGSGGD